MSAKKRKLNGSSGENDVQLIERVDMESLRNSITELISCEQLSLKFFGRKKSKKKLSGNRTSEKLDFILKKSKKKEYNQQHPLYKCINTIKMNDLLKIYQKEVSPRPGKILKSHIVGELFFHFFGLETPLQKRKRECENIKALKNTEPIQFLTLCGTVIPRDVLLILFDYLPRNYDVITKVGGVCKSFYVFLLTTWDHVEITSLNVRRMSALAISSSKSVTVVSYGSAKNQLRNIDAKYLIENLDSKRLRTLRIRGNFSVISDLSKKKSIESPLKNVTKLEVGDYHVNNFSPVYNPMEYYEHQPQNMSLWFNIYENLPNLKSLRIDTMESFRGRFRDDPENCPISDLTVYQGIIYDRDFYRRIDRFFKHFKTNLRNIELSFAELVESRNDTLMPTVGFYGSPFSPRKLYQNLYDHVANGEQGQKPIKDFDISKILSQKNVTTGFRRFVIRTYPMIFRKYRIDFVYLGETLENQPEKILAVTNTRNCFWGNIEEFQIISSSKLYDSEFHERNMKRKSNQSVEFGYNYVDFNFHDLVTSTFFSLTNNKIKRLKVKVPLISVSLKEENNDMKTCMLESIKFIFELFSHELPRKMNIYQSFELCLRNHDHNNNNNRKKETLTMKLLTQGTTKRLFFEYQGAKNPMSVSLITGNLFRGNSDDTVMTSDDADILSLIEHGSCECRPLLIIFQMLCSPEFLNDQIFRMNDVDIVVIRAAQKYVRKKKDKKKRKRVSSLWRKYFEEIWGSSVSSVSSNLFFDRENLMLLKKNLM